MMMNRIAAFASLVAMTGCLGFEDAPDSAQYPLIDGTPEAVGVLRFLNGPDATFEVLDVDAALDRRAARGIVDHVRGPDGALGTADDDPLDDIAELDGCYYVGPAAIDRLVVYVESIGGIPNIEIEGVVLTAAEADAIVMVANEASEQQLDVDAALDARAAGNLVAARPLADIDAVAAVPWVGSSALGKLRDYAPSWTAPPPPDEGCDATVAPRVVDDVQRFDELLARATTLDWAYAEMVAAQAPVCLDLSDAAARDALVEHLVVESGLDWQYGPDVYPSAGNLYPGSSQFLTLMARANTAIDEHVADGDWDPTATEDDAALWAIRDATYEALTARAAAEPGAFYEVKLRIEAVECSQDAVALVDASDLRIWIIHRLPGC